MSFALILSGVSTFQLNNAILLPKKDSDAKKVLFTGVGLVIGFSGLMCFLLLGLFCSIPSFFKIQDSTGWLLLLPFTICLSAVNVHLSAWFTRIGHFKVVSKARVAASIGTVICSLGFTFVMKGPGGLVISYFIGQSISMFILLVIFLSSNAFFFLTWAEVKTIVRNNSRFILFTTPTELINNFAQQLPIYIFSAYGGLEHVGWLSRSRQILALPINYISSSISEVYKQRSSEIYRTNRSELMGYYLRTLKFLGAFSIVPFLILAIFGPSLFALFFGEPWRMAGVYSQVLTVMYFLKFTISPTTFNFYLAGKQRLDLYLHLLIIFLAATSLFSGFRFYGDDVTALMLFSISYSLIYLIYGLYSYYFALDR